MRSWPWAFCAVRTRCPYIWRRMGHTGPSATANLTGQNPAQNNIDGSICVNIYAFAADEQEVACCSCLVTPNGLWSASVKTALLNSTLTSSFPNEVVLKLIPTAP